MKVTKLKLHITRKFGWLRKNYQVCESDAYLGLGRHTFGLLFQRLKLFKGEDQLYELRQTNVLLKLLDVIPLLGWMIIVPFQVFFQGKRIGRSRRIPFGYQIAFRDDLYEIRLHRDNICSVMKNGEQISLITKRAETWFEANEYEIQLPDRCCEDEQERILLLCMFIDVFYFPNDLSWYAYRKGKTRILHDDYPDRAEWRPS